MSQEAKSEDLIIPFSCAMGQGEPRLTASPETTYKVFGPREEQPFTSCQPGAAGRCTTMMVHRFAISCDGKRVAWAKVAAAGRKAGVTLPGNLPNGFAPVSSLAGRFVFPSLTASPPTTAVTKVSTQDLSADSVVEQSSANEKPSRPSQADVWTTTVSADVLPVADSDSGRVAVAIGTLMALLMGASMVAAGRWRVASFADVSHVAAGAQGMARQTWLSLKDAAQTIVRAANDSYDAWQVRDHAHPHDSLANAAVILQARLAETELLVATLPDGLLLREVLQAEIDRVRDRAMEAEKRMTRRAPEKTAMTYRMQLRELDRICRIAQGAQTAPSGEASYTHDRPAAAMPRSQHEAYRLLGLNAEAPPAVAKKLVDALRMTWHPDHARDEGDRRLREDRMKQINAAWDMIRDRKAAA